MKKASLFNTFDGEIVKPNKVRFLDADWDVETEAMEGFEVWKNFTKFSIVKSPSGVVKA